MIKKTVTYEDFNGQQITEELYFHLSKAELINMELSHEGGLSQILPAMIKDGNMGEVVRLFNRMIGAAYGTRTEDGKRFLKNESEAALFLTSPAYDALFTDLISSPDKASEFIQGIVPKDLLEQLAVQEKEQNVSGDNEPPPWIKEDREPTNDELVRMTHEQLLEVMRRKTGGISTPVPSQPKQVL